jgi:LPXTG-motif cell wall-anchored protein
MALPHWLMIAGALLVMTGFIGLAFRRKNGVESAPALRPGDLTPWKAQQPPISSAVPHSKDIDHLRLR